MIARGFRPVGWVAAVGAAALGCYMLSLRVAAERADLDRLDARIVAASQEIRALQTELGTRGRMQQLEQWNNEVLALAAPVSGQFVEGGVSLARFDIREAADRARGRGAARRGGDARRACACARRAAAPLQRPPAQPRCAAPPLVRRVSVTVPPAALAAAPPKPARTAPEAARARPAAPPPVRIAAAPDAEPAPRRRRSAPPPRRERSRPAPRRAAGLLDERTMRDLGAAARAERGGGTAN